jgi:hypothetical protein
VVAVDDNFPLAHLGFTHPRPVPEAG